MLTRLERDKMALFQVTQQKVEGEILNKWIDNRFKRNKNVLIALTGATGSGKSYTALRIAELWYMYKFQEVFPVRTHACFSIGEVMKLLSSGTLRKGELIILEEAGANLNALDFQSKVSKLFTFILQSFRSMNVGLIFTLPVLTMLNKSARMLLHGHFITVHIDFRTDTCKIKPFFLQLNQKTGKVFEKYMRVKKNGRVVRIERFSYKIPLDLIVTIYEQKKHNFVFDLSKDFSDKLDDMDKEHHRKMSRDDLTDVEKEIFEDCVELGLTPKESAKKRGKHITAIYQAIKRIEKKGFIVEKYKIYKENRDI